MEKKNYDNLGYLGKALEYINPEMLKNKRFIIIAGIILFITVFGIVYTIVMLTDQTASEAVPLQSGTTDFNPSDPDSADMVEVLPQMQRDNETGDDGSRPSYGPIMDPFADPIRLTGVVLGGRGGNMAIIESSGTSFIVMVGDYVDDLWAVHQISRGMAVLRAQNQELTLYLDRPPVTRSLDRRPVEDDPEEGA